MIGAFLLAEVVSGVDKADKLVGNISALVYICVAYRKKSKMSTATFILITNSTRIMLNARLH